MRTRALDRGQLAFFDALGVRAAIDDWSERPITLQSGMVVGYVNPPNSAIRAGHTRHPKHYTPARRAPSFRAVLISEDWYQGLTPAQRAVIDAAIVAGLGANRDWLSGWAALVGDHVAKAGVTVTDLLPGERDRMVVLSAPVHEGLLGADGPGRVMKGISQVRGQ